jgi:hypothetical protein
MTEDMFQLAKENHIGCEDCPEGIGKDFIRKTLEQYKYTPFKNVDDDSPELEYDSILEQVTKSIRETSFYLEFDSVVNFLQMVDFAVIDLAIKN